MKAEKNRNFLHKLYISGDGDDWDSFEELEAELTRIEELAAKGLRSEQAEITITDEIDAAEESGHSGTDYVVGLQVALNALKGVE